MEKEKVFSLPDCNQVESYNIEIYHENYSQIVDRLLAGKVVAVAAGKLDALTGRVRAISVVVQVGREWRVHKSTAPLKAH